MFILQVFILAVLIRLAKYRSRRFPLLRFIINARGAQILSRQTESVLTYNF